MYDYKCPEGERKEQGRKLWIHCNATNDVCLCQRYCLQKRDIEHTTDAPNCPLQKKEKNN